MSGVDTVGGDVSGSGRKVTGARGVTVEKDCGNSTVDYDRFYDFVGGF